MTRPTRILISGGALRRNLARAREAAPGCRVLAVVKADGYGHGQLRVAQALEAADGFGVASIDEALALRAAGVRRRILLLEGIFSEDELEPAAREDLDVTVHHASQLEMLERARLPAPLRVWLKIDTGMQRLGFATAQAPRALSRLRACTAVTRPVNFMTHLANADDRRDPRTREQIEAFRRCVGAQEGEVSIANSAGLLGWPEARAGWVRPGIMLYGISPFIGGSAAGDGLEPVMTLATRLVAVNRARAGAAVGYGGTWVCPEDMPIGVVAAGYGDGYPRHAPSGTPVLVNGERVPLIGRVSMDLLTVDLRTQPGAQPGDEVVLWGRGLAAEEVAQHAGTIAYELVCRVARRVQVIGEESALGEPHALGAQS